MDAVLNRRSLMIGVPGIVLQLVGNFMTRGVDVRDPMFLVGLAVMLVGTVLLIGGLGLYAEAKGHSRWWGLMGFLSLIGLLVLVLLSDRRK